MKIETFVPAAGAGPFDAIVLIPDAGGFRESFAQLCQAIADRGFVVASPDIFHRTGTVLSTLPQGEQTFVGFVARMKNDPTFRATLGTFMAPATEPENVRNDVGETLAFLSTHPNVKAGPVAITGYCMGGGIALRAASQYPERITAVASFHGGNLATDHPNSPHLVLPLLKAEVEIAGADADDTFPPAMQSKLADAIADAGIKATLEIWKGAHHGFAVPDHSAYTPEFGKRHLETLVALCHRALS